MADINVTPFVDVMLVLLVIFMITAPLMQHGMDLELPQESTETVEVKDVPTVSVRSNKTIYWNKEKMATMMSLTEKLTVYLKQHKGGAVYFRADRSLDYGFVVKVMSTIRRAGGPEYRDDDRTQPMRSAQSPPIDFNQMLVASVFFHFFLFTAFMFLPQTQDTVKRIKPAFTVSFVSIPTGPPDIQPVPQEKVAPVAPAPPKPTVAEKPVPKPKIAKPIPEPKAAEPIPKPVPKPKPIPERSAASKALVSKLDELARKKAPKKDKVAMVVPKPKDNFLDDFAKTKMQTEVEEKKKPTPKIDTKKQLTPEEKMFQELSKKSASQKSQDKTKRPSSLLKELDELSDMNKQHAALSKPETKQTSSKPSELVKQLEAIKKEKVQIKIDTSKLSSRHSQKVQIWNPQFEDGENPEQCSSTGCLRRIGRSGCGCAVGLLRIG